MAEPVQSLNCFINSPVPNERYYIYDVLLQILAALGGATPGCLSVEGCESPEFPVLTSVATAQGSTTSGETGPLIQGAVTTSAPTYTNGQTNPLSLTTSGALRVAVTSGGSGAQTVARSVVSTSGTVSAGATSVTIFSSSDFSGTVAGAVFSPSIAENFTAQPGSTLGAISYTRSAGSLTISTIT